MNTSPSPSPRTARSRVSPSSPQATLPTSASSPCVRFFSFLPTLTLTELEDPIPPDDAVLIRLGIQVDWTDEKRCFETFLRELAYFYVPGPPPFLDSSKDEKEEKEETRQIQHVVFPVAKQYLSPPTSMLKRDVVQVTSLESLFKVWVVLLA
jgi:hypothetical protein